LIGGMMQAHLNVEPVRHFTNAVHWGDTLLFFLRRLMLDLGLDGLWQTRLRSFGTYDGVLSVTTMPGPSSATVAVEAFSRSPVSSTRLASTRLPAVGSTFCTVKLRRLLT